MSTTLGSLRRLALSPSLADVSFGGRGFPAVPGPATRKLEAVPQAVVVGFEWGIDARSLDEVERRLAMVEEEVRGFAYEGATMAFTLLDALCGGRRARDLLMGSGRPHIFLTYIGIGFAMARLPRALWHKVVPDLTGTPYFPTMTWLAVDGLGFDRAYFDTRRRVTEQRAATPYPWLGSPDYFPRAYDQGIGRCLWFVHGGRVHEVAAAVERFASERHADLWSGVGLAATFAGGCDAEGLATLRSLAGEHRAHLCQGMVFAAKARTFSGFCPPHTELAAAVLGDLSVTDAARLADDAAVAPGTGSRLAGAEPEYEVWRRRIREHFLAVHPLR
ncbi:MAG TPA: DUF1702 family protein [Pseudonocardiaceae bacterium]